MHIGEETLASIKCVDIPLFARLIECPIDIPLDIRKDFVIAANEARGLGVVHARDLRQAKGRLSIENSIDNGFGEATLILRHLLHWHIE